MLVGLVFPVLKAQKTIVLTDADIGRTIESIHEFNYDEPTFTFKLKHRMSHGLPVEVKLLRSEKFKKGPYSLAGEVPMVLQPGEAADLTFNVDYGRSIRDRSKITFLITPQGDADPMTRGVQFYVELTAKGMMMFWDNRANRYSTTLPNLSFGSPGDKLVEISWNGNGEGKGSFAINNNSRDAYKLISNTKEGTPIPIGSEFRLGKGGKSFFVRYSPPGGRRTSDVGTLVFNDLGSNGGGASSISVSLDAKGSTGSTAFLAGNNTGGVGTTSIFSGNSSSTINSGNTSGNTSGSGYKPSGGVGPKSDGNSSGNSGTNNNSGNNGNTSGNNASSSSNNSGNGNGFGTGRRPNRNVTAGTGNNNGGLVPESSGIEPESGSDPAGLLGDDRPIVDAATALERLRAIYENRSGYDHIIIPKITFKKDPDGNEPDKFTAYIPIALDTLLGDKNFKFTPHHVAAVTKKDSVELQILTFDEDSLRLRVGIHPDDEV